MRELEPILTPTIRKYSVSVYRLPISRAMKRPQAGVSWFPWTKGQKLRHHQNFSWILHLSLVCDEPHKLPTFNVKVHRGVQISWQYDPLLFSYQHLLKHMSIL